MAALPIEQEGADVIVSEPKKQKDQQEVKITELKREQEAVAQSMTQANNQVLRIYPVNKFGGKKGHCRFDVTSMRGRFPQAVVNFVSKACNPTYFPHRPSYGFAKAKIIKHPKPNHYVIAQSFVRKYANGETDGNYRSINCTFFFFKDDTERNNPDFDPQTVMCC